LNPSNPLATILLVDDDDALRSVTAENLREAGYTVDEAPDGRTCLVLYDAGHHDLVITDIAMPDMDGLELIMTLSHFTPAPRLIAISGDSQFSESLYLPTARQLGVNGTLSKPIRSALLLQTVAEVLAAPRPG
jgi:two-component system chemotaxis response regulator CheY